MKKAKKILLGILLTLLALILLLAGVLFFFSMQNNTVMYDTIDSGMDAVRERYTVKELDAGEFTDMKFYGFMKFHVDQYEVEGLGNLSVMRANMGFMQMFSFMITPFEKNVPLCTLDYMYIMGNRKSYVEFYDLAGDTASAEYAQVQQQLRDMVARYADIEEIPASQNWYDDLLNVVMHKKLSRKDEQRNMDMFRDALNTYLNAADAVAADTPELAEKQLANTQAYSDGLIEKGGVSTDVFKKALGEDKTREFFDKVFFGTARYRQ